MSEKIVPRMATATEAARRTNHHNSRLRRAVTGVALVGAASAATGAVVHEVDAQASHKIASSQQKQIDQLAALLGGQANVSKDTVERKGLRSVESLPGYGQQVSPTDAKMLQASTVQIISRPKAAPSSTGWGEGCTGLKIRDGKDIFVVTARHCIQQVTTGMKGGGDMQPVQAYNVTKQLAVDYAVQPVSTAGTSYGMAEAKVSTVAISAYADWALMKVDDNSLSAQAFQRMPAITYRPRINDSNQYPAVPGMSTKVYSLPQAANGYEVKGDGIYLGTVDDPAMPGRDLDIVGVKGAVHPNIDPCNYGASGSTAILASGHLLGPLSMRNNIGYTPTTTNYPDKLSESIPYRLQLEQALHIDASEFPTLCGYTAPMGDTVGQLIGGIYSPPLPALQLPQQGGMK